MRKGFVLLVALVGCRDLLGIDDFTPPAEREPAIDIDTPVSGGSGGGGGAETAPKLAWWRALGGRADDRLSSIALGAGGPVVGGVVDTALLVLSLDADGMPGASLVSQGPGSVERALMAIAPDGS